MAGKIDIHRIVKDHLATLYDQSSISEGGQTRLYWPDIFVFYFMPLSLGIAILVFRIQLPTPFISATVVAGSIFTGLLLNLLVLVINQRDKVEDKLEEKGESAPLRKRLAVLNETHSNASYAAFVAILSVCTATISLIFNDAGSAAPGSVIAPSVVAAIICALELHLVLTILMVLKRVHTLMH